MSKIEQAKNYSGKDLETIFFRPILSGPDAKKLGIKILYNMPVPTTLHFWQTSSDVLQKYSENGWTGGSSAEKYQKTIKLSRVKAEVGYSASDYFDKVYELISARSDVNMDDLSGTELEQAETALFKQAIAESIRNTMWVGNTSRSLRYNTFDGIITRLMADITADEEGEFYTKTYKQADITAEGFGETILKKVWDSAPEELRQLRSEGNLAFFATTEICNSYEESLNSAEMESAYLARQNGRDALLFRGIPVIDMQINNALRGCSDLPSSLVILTDRRNLALAVNTADFPGTEVRMWYNPDEMENRQRAVFMAGCDYLLPELISMAYLTA